MWNVQFNEISMVIFQKYGIFTLPQWPDVCLFVDYGN